MPSPTKDKPVMLLTSFCKVQPMASPPARYNELKRPFWNSSRRVSPDRSSGTVCTCPEHDWAGVALTLPEFVEPLDLRHRQGPPDPNRSPAHWADLSGDLTFDDL